MTPVFGEEIDLLFQCGLSFDFFELFDNLARQAKSLVVAQMHLVFFLHVTLVLRLKRGALKV